MDLMDSFTSDYPIDPDEFAAYAALALEWADLTLGVARRRLPSWASED